MDSRVFTNTGDSSSTFRHREDSIVFFGVDGLYEIRVEPDDSNAIHQLGKAEVLRGYIGELASLLSFDLLAHRLEVPLQPIDPNPETQPISENDFRVWPERE